MGNGEMVYTKRQDAAISLNRVAMHGGIESTRVKSTQAAVLSTVLDNLEHE